MDYLGRSNVITETLIRERGRQESHSQRRRDKKSRGRSDEGPRDKECSPPLEAEKGTETDRFSPRACTKNTALPTCS